MPELRVFYNSLRGCSKLTSGSATLPNPMCDGLMDCFFKTLGSLLILINKIN